MMLSKRTRIMLALTGLLIILISALILSFAFKNPDYHREQITIVPTLLTPPAGLP